MSHLRFWIGYLLLGVSFLSLMFDAPILWANEQGSTGLIHFPLKTAYEKQPAVIEARIENPSLRVEYLRLYYRQKGQSNFQYVEMQEQMNSYRGEIPAAEVKSTGLEYFIMAVLSDHSMITSPDVNPYYAPYEITVMPNSSAPTNDASSYAPQKPRVQSGKSDAYIQTEILSPEPDAVLPADEVVIALSFLGEVEKLKLKSIRLLVDDVNVTRQAKVTPHLISYVPQGLSAGRHQVKIQFADKQGHRYDDITWNFSARSSSQEARQNDRKPMFSGNAFAEWKNEHISDSTLVSQNAGANFRGHFGPLEYRGLAFVTSREKPQFQPRNRFLLEVGTSWIGVKLGDTSPRFNELMLWGLRVRGIEAYLKLGLINLEFVQGETNRKIPGIPFDTKIDPITGRVRYYIPGTTIEQQSTTGIYRYGTFKQNLMAGRLSFGGGKYFQLGLNLVKVRDDTATNTYSTQPKDNLVIGPDIVLALDNHRIELKASAAFSLLANDISNGAISKSELDSTLGEIPFDPSDYADYFILNTSLIPLDPSQLTSLAYQASFKFNYFNHNIQAVYKSVGSEFCSLANTFMRRDLQGFSIYDRIRMFQNQVYLNLGYEKYLEGLSYEDDGEPTTEPMQFNALNIGVSLYPRSTYLPKINVNWKNYRRDDGLDTTITAQAVNYRNTDIGVQLAYDMQLFDLNHTLSIGYITADRVDGFKRTEANLANNLRMFSLRTVYRIPLTTVISYATNLNEAAGGNHSFQYNMLSLAADYSLFQRRLNVRGGFSWTSAVGSSTVGIDSLGNPLPVPVTQDFTDYKRTCLNVGGSYQVTVHHGFLFDMSFINFNDKLSKTYSDSIIRFRYEFRY